MHHTLIKICGITNPEDALVAGMEGADLIGMILWKHSKRFVTIDMAKEISSAAKSVGAIPVAVFVDGHPEQVHETCQSIDVRTIQLHGAEAKSHISDFSKSYTCFYAVTVSSQGFIEEPLVEQAKQHADFLLFDHGKGGTGCSFCWESFQPPKEIEWFLAGGITPENVHRALKLGPKGIDVASGVEKPGTVVKDYHLIKNLIQKVREQDETS